MIEYTKEELCNKIIQYSEFYRLNSDKTDLRKNKLKIKNFEEFIEKYILKEHKYKILSNECLIELCLIEPELLDYKIPIEVFEHLFDNYYDSKRKEDDKLNSYLISYCVTNNLNDKVDLFLKSSLRDRMELARCFNELFDIHKVKLLKDKSKKVLRMIDITKNQ